MHAFGAQFSRNKMAKSKKRNRASTYDTVLYESERKRFHEGRTASSAAISATRRRHWLNWAPAVSSSKRRSFHANQPDLGSNEREGQRGARAHRRFHARKSCADYSRRARSWNRDRPGHPLRRSR